MCYTNENKFMNLYTVNNVCDLKNDFTLGYYVTHFITRPWKNIWGLNVMLKHVIRAYIFQCD
jgi:hypothetical protein